MPISSGGRRSAARWTVGRRSGSGTPRRTRVRQAATGRIRWPHPRGPAGGRRLWRFAGESPGENRLLDRHFRGGRSACGLDKGPTRAAIRPTAEGAQFRRRGRGRRVEVRPRRALPRRGDCRGRNPRRDRQGGRSPPRRRSRRRWSRRSATPTAACAWRPSRRSCGSSRPSGLPESSLRARSALLFRRRRQGTPAPWSPARTWTPCGRWPKCLVPWATRPTWRPRGGRRFAWPLPRPTMKSPFSTRRSTVRRSCSCCKSFATTAARRGCGSG